LCREIAVDLCNATSTADIPIFAVVKEAGSSDGIDTRGDPNFADYAAQYFTCGPVYLDKDWSFYNALGARKIGLAGFYDYMWNPMKAISRIRTMREKQIDGALGGDGLTLGGVIVMAPGDKGVLYTYLEDVGNVLPTAEIREAVDQVVAMRRNAQTSDAQCKS